MIHISSILNCIETIRYFFETGVWFNIKNLSNPGRCIARPEKPSTLEIEKGVWLQKESRKLTDESFTNIYDLYWDPAVTHFVPEIISSNTPYYLEDTMTSDPNMIATINGGYFFLVDVPVKEPVDYRYNFTVDHSKLIGLPLSDEPIAYIQNGKMIARETNAVGECQIGNRTIKWVGVRSTLNKPNMYDAILYNSKCIEIVRYRDPVNNLVIGAPDETNTHTPVDESIVDIVVAYDSHDTMVITSIKKGGGTHYFDGLFIFQMKADQAGEFKVGDHVQPLTLDGIEIAPITSGITIGRSIFDPYFYTPERINRRDVRVALAQDVKGYIHFLLFDANKYVPGFKGVSAKDLAPYFNKDDFAWAYFLDGGGSARIIARTGNGMTHMGNRFGYQKLPKSRIIWNWKKARKIYSSIAIKKAS